MNEQPKLYVINTLKCRLDEVGLTEPSEVETLRAENARLKRQLSAAIVQQKTFRGLAESAENTIQELQAVNTTLRTRVETYQERATQLQKTLDMLLAHDPRYAGMKNDESQTDSKYLNAYIKMVEEEFPHTPYWDGIYWCFPYEMRGEGGFGGGVGVAKFSSFRVAMDSAMKIAFPS